MKHQPGTSLTLVETEEDAIEPVFYTLQEKGKGVFLEADSETMVKYMTTGNPIIVTKLITQSPLETIGKIKVPTLEKILVDIFCEPFLFSSYQGAEQRNIFREAFDRYIVAPSRMLRYASRRGRKEEIIAFIRELDINIKDK